MRFQRAHYTDFDSIVESVPDHGGEYLQLERGVVDSTVELVHLDRVFAVRFTEEAPAYAFHASAPEGAVSLVLALEGGQACWWRGVPVHARTLIAYGPGAEHVGRSRGALSSLVVHVAAGALERHAAALGMSLDVARASARTLVPERAVIDRLRRESLEIFDAADAEDDPLAAAEVRRALEDELLTAAAHAIASAPEEADGTASAHRAAVRRAVERLAECDARPVYLAELCEAAGVSERTLRSAFQRVYGVSPIRFLHLHRMRHARRALVAGDPSQERVCDVAQRFGFANLGRFAGEFRALFGVTPSQLLRASR